MDRIPLDEVKNNFSDVLKLVANARQRLVISDQDGDRVAIIPVEDLELLDSLDGDVNIPIEHVDHEEVRNNLVQDVALVADQEQRIVIQEEKRDRAALVPQRDLRTLENLDTRLDIEAAKRLLEKGQDDAES